MPYEKFRKKVEWILEEKAEPVTWDEIKASSTKLKQKAPYHVYVQKLQGDIGLVRFKRGPRTVLALGNGLRQVSSGSSCPRRFGLQFSIPKRSMQLQQTNTGN